MTGYLTTHVLDTSRGCPAEGLKIDLYRIEVDARLHLRSLVTNADGRTDQQMLSGDRFRRGVYELLFHAGPYLDQFDNHGEGPRFLDTVPIRFGIDDAQAHYHVPLLLSAYGYSTYRGS